MCSLLSVSKFQEREKAVEYWRVKYSDDTSSINMRLAVKCEQLRVAVARREELQKLVGEIQHH